MKALVLLIYCFIAGLVAANSAAGVDQVPYLCLGERAKVLLDSLEHSNSPDTMAMVVLAHNIAFKTRDKKMREKAEKLLEKWAQHDTSAVVDAYSGSLRMIKVRDKGKLGNGLKLFGSLFGGESPFTTARKAFGRINMAVKDDPTSLVLRFLRSSAAVESAEFLPELLAVAYEDLLYLDSHVLPDDTVGRFFLLLTWAKYFHNSYLSIDDPSAQYYSEYYICAAWDLVNQQKYVPDYRVEANIWEHKIFFEE